MADEASESLNVLVIDDDDGMRQLMMDLVAKRGHQAVAAESAEEALTLLPHWTFQLAFIDHNLPGMEGLMLGEYLRRHNPDMQLALVTGSDDRTLPRKAKQLGILFVEKPFEPSRIYRIIDEYHEVARERADVRRARSDALFEPPIAQYAEDVTSCFGIPKVPGRIEGRVVDTIKRCLNNLRSSSRYTERDRVVALSGLLTAKVLGMDLPKASSGCSLYEEYDRLMVEHGRRQEFQDLSHAAE